jgi:hypothetical protein
MRFPMGFPMSFPMIFPKEMPPCLEMSVLLFSIDPRLSPKSAIFGKRASIGPVAHYSLAEMARGSDVARIKFTV